MKLTDKQVEQYFEEGWLAMPGLFSAHDVARMATAFDAIWQQAQDIAAILESDARLAVDRNGAKFTYQKKALRFIAWCGKAHPLLDEVGRDPRLLSVAGQLLKSNSMEQLINQAHYKMPSDGVAFPWHQDSAHRGIDQGRFVDLDGHGSYVQTTIAIDEVTPENGPLGLIPRSHLKGHMQHVTKHTGGSGLPDERVNEADAIYPCAQPGDVLLFGPYTIHGSTHNVSKTPRRLFINGYATPGANQGAYGEMRSL